MPKSIVSDIRLTLSNDDEHGKCLLGQDIRLQTNVLRNPSVAFPTQISMETHQDNQFDQPLATHQHAYRQAFSPNKLHASGRQSAADDLTRERNGYDGNNVCPGDAIVE